MGSAMVSSSSVLAIGASPFSSSARFVSSSSASSSSSSSFSSTSLSFSRRSVSRSTSAVVLRKVRLGTPVCSTQAQATAPITFHIGETSLTVPFSENAAKGLSSAIAGLLTTFKEKEKASRPRRWESMEYRAMEEGVSFEIVCNPNAHATAFQARYLITINHEKIRVASEGQLSALKSDVDNYVEARN
ncbi:hypothetical protein CY35_18G032000 [Sphagnum magellanicum]|nr:hypothetical protein CY35_18G032000 [Sphagnum magellanicum]